MMHKAWCCMVNVPYCFSISSAKFHGRARQKNHWLVPKFGVSGLWLKFEFTDGFELMHKAWSSIKGVPYCFARSSINLQCHTGQKSPILTRIEYFRPVTPISIHRWISKWCPQLDVVQKRCPIVFRGPPLNLIITQDKKINDLNPI